MPTASVLEDNPVVRGLVRLEDGTAARMVDSSHDHFMTSPSPLGHLSEPQLAAFFATTMTHVAGVGQVKVPMNLMRGVDKIFNETVIDFRSGLDCAVYLLLRHSFPPV
jgi:hypothetical protein